MINLGESDVARLRSQIETECVALKQAFTGFGVVARHNIIQHKYASIGNHRKKLEDIVGEEKAGEIVGSIYLEVMEHE